jgi:hypothetical protein
MTVAAHRQHNQPLDTFDGYPKDLERVLPESALNLFADVRRICGVSVRPLVEREESK